MKTYDYEEHYDEAIIKWIIQEMICGGQRKQDTILSCRSALTGANASLAIHP